MKYISSRIALAPLWFALIAPACAEFQINLVYRSGTPSLAQRAAFDGAKQLWESLITGYIDDNNTASNAPLNFTGPTIDAFISPDDGPGGKLGSARPISTRALNANGNGYVYALTGRMDFDSEDFGAESVFDVEILKLIVAHEMGHVLGLGTLWDDNGVYSQAGSLRGKYQGEHGILAYQQEFDPTAEFVPVELGGSPGTPHFHWDEPDFGAAFTGLLDNQGRDFTYELMTGWLNFRLYPPFISQTTVQSFRDLGYTVIPEPASGVGLALAALGLVIARRRWQNCRLSA